MLKADTSKINHIKINRLAAVFCMTINAYA